MEKTITGTIDFTLKITDEHIDIDFNSSVDNDIAVLAMNQYLMESAATGLKMQKANTKGNEKKIAQQQLELVLKARQGLRVLMGLFLESYDEMKENEGKEKKITIETGMLSEEEAKILNLPSHDKTDSNL